MGRQALALAEGGYYVFPLEPGGKAPLTRHGFKDASLDPGRIRAWWKRWPRANVGIACGLSGIIVVDLDVKLDRNGTPQQGPANWDALVEGLDYGPPTVEVRTPSGGLHLYWRGAGVPSSNGQVASGVDIKAEGGYVVAPGSVVGGKAYVIEVTR